MESNLNQDGAPRPSYVFSADPVERPSEINLDGIKLDLSHEFSLVASSDEINSLESKDYLQVCLRIRPLTQSEKEQDSEGCVCIVDSQTVLLKDPQSIIGQSSEKNSGQMVQKFHFSKVFGPETTQKEFFLGCLMQLVKDLFKGQSRLIFTYGVTNSGKTYTIQGTEENIGILPRTLNVLFDSLREKLYTKMDLKPHRSREYIRLSPEQEKEEVTNKTTLLRQIKEIAVNNDSSDTLHGTLINSLNTPEFEEVLVDCEQTSLNMDSNIKFSVWVSFFEIYNECIYDLFVPVSPKSQKRKMLRLSQDVKGYSFIKDLQWIQVSDSKEAYKLLKVGIKNQSVAFTKLNNASSRSHSIFTIRILWIEDSDMPHVVRVSELTLCDLAGSERSMKTQNEGERLRETGNINTSLLTLGKCINVLKNNEKSKFQKHVPFRESKLTHYFQSFFNGKGKICMIVNISQCDLAYDETLSVLKFSAVAQKVLVPDAFNTSLEKSCAAVKPSQAIPPDINASNNKALNIKRTTISWESNLEDLVEDEDLPEDVEKAEENQTVGIEFTEEDTEQTLEEDKILIGQEEKRKLLDLIEDLKQKLINEKKEKLTLEFKIREEVTQEFTQYLAQREADFKETLLQEREILEENAECRLAIFKDLVGKCETQEEPKNEDCTMKVETEGARNCVEIEDIFDSLQDDVSDIRKQIELAHSYIASLADPQEALSSLEIKFNQVKAELAKTREELVKTQEKLANRENESQINLNSLVQEHGKSNEDKTDESLKMNNKLTCNEIIEIHKDNTIKSSSERKRSNESEHQEDEPPAKKGPMYINPSIIEERKKSEDTQERISKENDRRVLKINNELESHLLSVENELISVKKEKAELNQLIVTLQQELSISEEKIFSLSTEVQQIQSKYKNAISELHVQKGMNQEQEIKIEILSEELETTRKNITNNVAQIKLMQTKIDELRMLDSGSPISSIDLLSLRELSSGSQKDSLMNSQLHRLSNQLKETFIQELSRDGSFHSSIEAIWEECKEIVKVSSQKSHRIQELEQKIEKLQSDVKAYAEENDRLRREERETKNQDDQLKEKDRLIQQLKEELQEKTIRLNSEVQCVVEGKRALSELTQDITGSKAKIEELEKLLEAHKDKYSSSARLEQEILEKESVILKLEKNLEEFQANLQDSIKNTKDLNEREVKLKEEITQLTNNLQDVQYSLQQKEEEHETNRQDLEKLKEDLCASCTLNQNLQADLQKKEEDYTELKEKLSDAKKQIEQVQKEVCVMRDEEKLLRLKINELEKKKNQCSQEIDMKQRTIQQLKEQLNNQKMEDTVQQYEKVCKDLNVKEKIIADMRMTLEEQEQTQMEQDQVLEAKAEELERLATELEQWKEKFKNLETKNNPNSKKEFEDTTNALSKQLRKLQDELQESEQKYTTDRKKWLDEKVKLITQAKEAENLRNIEMKKYNEDRERCLKLQKEVEKLADQLAEKETNLQRWREERDQLVAALEIQLKALISSNVQKDTEIEQLKKVTAEASKVEKPSVGIVPEHINSADPGIVEPETLPTSFETCTNEVERGSVVLDSCEVSTENVHVTRFPKPELEIQFTPLRPNKVSVKHPGCTLPVTVKISKPKKRKSSDMEEDLVKCENKKNSTPRCNLKFPVSEHRNSSVKKEQKVSVHPSTKKAYSLRSQASTVSVNLKKEGTLQKFGDFLQQSPTILQSKAKKLIETISSSKPGHTDVKEYASRPKRAKRKLYTSEISSPIDLSGEVILMDKKVKESDHQILKRRLRAKMAK